MLFHHGRFAPELISDQRVREVLCAAVEQATDLVRPSDILASAIRHTEGEVLSELSAALRPGFAPQDLLGTIEASRAPPAAGPRASRQPAVFAPQTVQALHEFDAILEGSGGVLDGVALELLVFCVLTHLDEQEQRILAGLDPERAAARYRQQVEKAVDPAPDGEADDADLAGEEDAGVADGEAFLLPPQLAPSEDLTHRARTAAAPAAFPFDDEPVYERLFDSIARVLHRRQANHVLLTGERGAGKSTVIAEVARRAATGRIPFLGTRRFLSVDCRYIPPDESRPRLVGLFNHIGDHPELVVCLDGFASLLRGERELGNKEVLLAGLSRIRCQLVGLLTPREFEELICDDPDFAEFFARVEVEEPDVEVALKLLRHFAAGLEHKFQVAIDAEAVRQAVVLSANYILNDQLPAKALKLLHRVCEDIDYERGRQGARRNRVTADDMVRAVSEASGVPEETLRGIAERSDYEQSLREVILGQDHVVRTVATELGLIKAGLTDPNKPASVMMFLGQTGTGKTEMAKALARFYSTTKRLKTYTLGNCVEPHSVATIIGVPPGYVGNDQGGRLVNELNADPYCVFLLDEADKAHPDVLQPFLNLFDEGWVCDQRGVRAYANKSIFILTTNVGQRMIADMVQQGKGMDEVAARMKEALSQIRHTKSERPVFTPEFLSRIKHIIVFNPLNHEAMQGICRRLVAEMQQTWAAKRGKSLRVPEALVRYIADEAHRLNEKSQSREGGRIVRKLIAEWIEALVQREATQRPGEYRGCIEVALEFTPPPETPPAGEGQPPPPEIRLRFLSRSE
jgi:ATP-dependent Clp protease ATP-binding subunit ClpA